jgi:hypothetical protein
MRFFANYNRSLAMRSIQWAAILLGANILHLWMFLHLNVYTHPTLSWVGFGIHTAACIGPFWMLYDWFVKRGKRTWTAWMWLCFVPWGFLWYYFEQHRPSKASQRSTA